MAENLCHKAGCPDLCCRGMWFSHVSIIEQKRVFPEVEEVSDDYDERDMSPGIVYKVGNLNYGSRVTLFVAGVCPHLVSKGCDGTRLKACDNFEFGGLECNVIRADNGLPPVFMNEEEIAATNHQNGSWISTLLFGKNR